MKLTKTKLLKQNPKKIFFLTSNKNKFKEAEKILNKFGIKIIRKNSKGIEIQSDSLEEIARVCAAKAYESIKRPLIVEDSGLFVDCLSGFPGPYSSYVLKTVGCKGILDLLGQKRQRSAKFVAVVAYASKNKIKIFKGIVRGKISKKIFKGKGFGYDPIFIPDGYSKPFSRIYPIKEKISHRALAFEKLGKYLKGE
jgi:non-canonical purine NTP pyrophosphatase, rdgB/HAM1 family